MKVRILILLFFWGSVDLSAQTIVQQFAAISQTHGDSGSGSVSDMDLEPSGKGNLLIAMPGLILAPGVKVLSVTDNAPDGGNTYRQVPDAISSCGDNGPLDIWYCENCKPGVTELKFHFSGRARASINSFLEVSNMASSSVLDGNGAHVSNGTATSAGLEVGPSVKTTATDFIIARYFSSADPNPTGVTPAAWTHKPSYAFVLNGPPGTYQPTLTGGKAASSFCMSVAAFKIAGAPAVSAPNKD
jgi:hypothetical protein